MIPVNQFAPVTSLDSYFTAVVAPIPSPEISVISQAVHSAPPVPVQIITPVVDAVLPRQRIPAPTMRWSARPAQAIGVLSDNPCAACPHA